MDGDYVQWVKEIAARYRRCQVKASIKVNQEMLSFYWDLGHDIVSRHAENKYGSKFYASISRDLQSLLPISKDFQSVISAIVRSSICFIPKWIGFCYKLWQNLIKLLKMQICHKLWQNRENIHR